MKKLILFLLLPLWAIAQTTTGQEQEFDYGIKNNSTQTITTPPYLTTTGMDGTQGKIPSALIEKTDNKQNSLAVDGTGVKYPTVDAVNTGLALKALDYNVVHKTGDETVAGNKALSGTTTLNETIIREGYRLIFPRGVMYQSSVGTNALTGNRTVSFPDASGSVALISQTVTNGVLTSSPSQDAVYDFVTANAVTLGMTNGLSLSGQQISLGLSSTSTIGALSSTDWNVFNNKENAFSKNTAFNKNFGTTAGTVAEGNDSRILNGQTAFGWGNHASAGYALTTGSNINQSSFRTALGLGSNAYSSTAYLPLTGGDVSGSLKVIVDGRQLILTGSDQGAVDLYKSGTFGYRLFSDAYSFGIYDFENDSTVLSISKATEAATFSSTITATSFNGSATLTGTPTAPTAALGTNTTQIATTAFVQTAKASVLSDDNTFTGSQVFNDTVNFNNIALLKSYTVSTLPTGMIRGAIAYVTDALAPTYMTTVVGGGSVVCPVFYNGTAWVAH